MLRFLREPRWIALIISVPVGVTICLLLSSWQWDRYEGRKDANQIQTANVSQPTTAVASVMPLGTVVDDSNLWRSVTATGTYATDDQVLVRKRPLDGVLGFWVVTPLVTTDGSVVVVNRGWVKAGSDALTTPTVPAPPSGQVTVIGRVQGSAPAGKERPAGLPPGQVSSLDVATIGSTAGANVFPGYVELTSSDPPQTGVTLLPEPQISEGPHLSYSLQWIAFGIMFCVGLFLLARREIQTRRREAELAALQGTPANWVDGEDPPLPAERDRLPQDSAQ